MYVHARGRIQANHYRCLKQIAFLKAVDSLFCKKVTKNMSIKASLDKICQNVFTKCTNYKTKVVSSKLSFYCVFQIHKIVSVHFIKFQKSSFYFYFSFFKCTLSFYFSLVNYNDPQKRNDMIYKSHKLRFYTQQKIENWKCTILKKM